MKRMIALTALAAIVAALCAAPARAWTFAQITDLHVSKTEGKDILGQNFGKISNNIVALTEKPKFVLVSGDLVESGQDENYTELTKRMYYHTDNTWYLKNLNGSKSDIPVYFTPGNHDTRPKNWSPGLGSLSSYDSKIQYEASKPKPVQPGTTTPCIFGSGVGSHDYYFTYSTASGSALVVSLFAGKDAFTVGTADYPEAAGLENAQITWLRGVLADPANSSKKPKIIFIHNPIVTSESELGDGCIDKNRVGFAGACKDYAVDKVLVGHMHWDDKRTIVTGTEQVRTAPGYRGNFRIFTVDASNNVTVGNSQGATDIWPTVTINNPPQGSIVQNGITYTIKAEIDYDLALVDKVEFLVDGVPIGTRNREWNGQKYYYMDYKIPLNKAVDCLLGAKVYAGTKTNTAAVTVIKGAQTYYNKLNVGGTVSVIDPVSGATVAFTLAEIYVADGVRKARISISNQPTLNDAQAGKMYKVGGLFIYPATLFIGTETFSEIMIAPYQYPSVDIIVPEPNISTNNCIVMVATNYSGKNVPWNGIGNPPINAEQLKSLSFNGSAAQYAENITWVMSGTAGSRTMSVNLTDKLGATVSKCVTVNYNPTLPFHVLFGPYGDEWKGFSKWYYVAGGTNYTQLVMTRNNGASVNIFYPYFYVSSKQEEINKDVNWIASAINGSLPTGGTSVYVVDKNQYETGSWTSGFGYGTITYREYYDALALVLGKDAAGLYRVWASASAGNRSPADAVNPNPPATNAPVLSSVDSKCLRVRWNDVINETGYKVERAEYNGTAYGAFIAASPVLPPDKTEYNDSGLTPCTKYKYRVITLAPAGCVNRTSPESEVTTARLRAVLNGDFENTDHYWNLSATYGYVQISSNNPYSGEYCLRAFQTGTVCDYVSGSASQTITVPDDALSLDYAIRCARAAWTDRVRRYRVYLGGQLLDELYFGAAAAPWITKSIDIKSYRGKTLALTYEFYASEPYGIICLDNVRIIDAVPTVAITAPANGSSVPTGAATTITATATDSGGINRVEFYANGDYIGQDFTSPYTCDWTPQIAKSYTITAKAYDMTVNTNTATRTVIATGIVGYWKLDAVMGTIATDNSGNDNQGTLVNGPTWVAGQVNNGLSFDGVNDYVNCGSGASLNIGAVGQSYSVSSWFKTSTLKDQSISEKWLSSGGTYPYCLRGPLGDGSLRFAAYDVTNNPCAVAAGNYADGAWHHVVGVRDATADMVRIYVDGVLKGEVNDNTVGNLQNAASVVVGRRHVDGGCQFNGMIDEVRICNKALSAAEIDTLYVNDRFINGTRVAGGAYHSLALKPDGTVWAWGLNTKGQLGDSTVTQRTAPVKAKVLTNAMAVAAGDSHSVAIKRDGTIWAWGYNGYGQLGDSTVTQRNYPVKAKKLTGVIAVAGGAFHSLALKSDGTVWAWGRNHYYQLGDSTVTQRNYPVKTKVLTGVVAIAAGSYHALALKGDGTVWAWGYNAYGQLGVANTINQTAPVKITSLTGIVAIAAGNFHSLAIKSDGTAWAWGRNANGQLGDSTITQRTAPVLVKKVSNVTAIAGDYYHSLAVQSDGTAWAWGYNANGRLGDSTTTQRTYPVKTKKLAGATAVAAGNAHSLAIKTDGTVWAWGYNATGQLGDGTTTQRTTPVQVSGGLLVKGAAGNEAGDDIIEEIIEEIAEPVKPAMPVMTRLNQSYPNPLNQHTIISYQLISPAQVSLKVYNISGQLVKTLVNECVRPGYHSVRWDGKDGNGNKVAAGVYLYRMQAGEYAATRKLTVLR